jgi:predicted  nucleic acid-binding Zn-ribbon protein
LEGGKTPHQCNECGKIFDRDDVVVVRYAQSGEVCSDCADQFFVEVDGYLVHRDCCTEEELAKATPDPKKWAPGDTLELEFLSDWDGQGETEVLVREVDIAAKRNSTSA